ncbi:hypothetical protein P3S67_006688 [Capsicum chacoense]
MGRLKLNSDQSPRFKHFSHPHELELCNQQHQNNPTPCSGCKLPPLSQMYTCKPCNFTLHLSCAQFPKLINHPSHPDHPLALLPKSKYPRGLFNCDACNRRGDGFSYHCRECEYDLHVTCASKPLKITHQLHQCQLELTFKNPYPDAKGFSCDVCQKIGVKQWLYRCSTCDFDVHLDCSKFVPTSAVRGSSVHLQQHHSFPGATSSHNQIQQPDLAAKMRPDQIVHSASSDAIGNQLPQTPMLSGQAMPNQHMPTTLGTAQATSNPLFHNVSTGSTHQYQPNQHTQTSLGRAQERSNPLFHNVSTGSTHQHQPNQHTQTSLGTAQARSNPLFHNVSTGSTHQHQLLQPPLIQGPVRPDQYMQPPGTNNDLMNAAVQGLVEVATQQVGQSIMQRFIGGGNNNDGNEVSPILRSIFGDSTQK